MYDLLHVQIENVINIGKVKGAKKAIITVEIINNPFNTTFFRLTF
jgi:hypothetical protein